MSPKPIAGRREKIHQCQLCTKRYADMKGLAGHMAKMHGVPNGAGMMNHHHHQQQQQLLNMKLHSDKKVPFVKMSQDDPLYPSSKKNYQVDSDNNNLGESNMIKEKVINNK